VHQFNLSYVGYVHISLSILVKKTKITVYGPFTSVIHLCSLILIRIALRWMDALNYNNSYR